MLILGDDTNDIDAVVDRVSERLQQPVKVSGGHILDISAAVGQSYTSGPILKLDDLLKDSDQAMYQAKGAREQSHDSRHVA